jgi:hypothetical protein
VVANKSFKLRNTLSLTWVLFVKILADHQLDSSIHLDHSGSQRIYPYFHTGVGIELDLNRTHQTDVRLVKWIENITMYRLDLM